MLRNCALSSPAFCALLDVFVLGPFFGHVAATLVARYEDHAECGMNGLQKTERKTEAEYKGGVLMRSQSGIPEDLSPDQFAGLLQKHGMDLPVENDLSALREPLAVGGKTVPNRICI